MLHLNGKLKIFNDKKAIGTVVGTVFFIAILLFFFSQVMLWTHQVNTYAEERTAERMNTPVRLETTSVGGSIDTSSSCDIVTGSGSESQHTRTHQLDSNYHSVTEADYWIFGKWLTVDYYFETGITNQQEMRKIGALSIHIYANYDDGDFEPCSILVKYVSGGFMDTGEDVLQGDRWINITLENPEQYIDLSNNGRVVLRFDSDYDGYFFDDNSAGTLKIDYMDVRAEPVALKVTALGGVDTHLVRLWIIEEETNNHTYRNLDLWVPAGGEEVITFGSLNPPYNPPAGSVVFKILTENGNMASCEYVFS